jgi:hypothetical protein
MLLRRGQMEERRLHPSRMRVDWRTRAMIVAVPKSARDFLRRLETRIASDSTYRQQLAEIVSDSEDDPTMITVGLFHTPQHTLTGVVIAVEPGGLVLLDSDNGRPHAELPWPTLCRLDIKHEHGYQIVGLAWYDGKRDVSERLRDGAPFELSEMRFAYMYMHADQESLGAIRSRFEGAAVPEEIHRRVPLL